MDFNSADEVFGKSQGEDGVYRRAVDMSPGERKELRESLEMGGHHLDLRRTKGAPSGRGVDALYGQYAAGPGAPAALKEELRRSTRHPKVHYGSSVSPELEGRIDRSLDPALLRRSKVPIAFHHGANKENMLAGGIPGHTATKGVGRVIINDKMVGRDGEYLHAALKKYRFGDVVNHETAHVVARGANPYSKYNDGRGGLHQGRAMGEEARADGLGVPGKGLYQQNGTVQDKSILARARKELERGAHPGVMSREEITDLIANQEHYHHVHERVADARLSAGRETLGHESALARVASAPKIKYAMGVSPRTAAIGGAALAVGGAGLLAHHLWDEHQHPRDQGKFIHKRGPAMTTFDSADEVFSKLTHFDEHKHRRNHGQFAQMGGTLLGAGAATAAAGHGAVSLGQNLSHNAGVMSHMGDHLRSVGSAGEHLAQVGRERIAGNSHNLTYKDEESKARAQYGMPNDKADALRHHGETIHALDETAGEAKHAGEALGHGGQDAMETGKFLEQYGHGSRVAGLGLAALGLGVIAAHKHHVRKSMSNEEIDMNNSADEVFAKARDHWGGAKTGGKIGAAVGGISNGVIGAGGGGFLGGHYGAQGPGMKGTLKGAAKTRGAVKGALIGGALLGTVAGASGAVGGGATGAAIGGAVGRKRVAKSYESADVEELFAKARQTTVEKGIGGLVDAEKLTGGVESVKSGLGSVGGKVSNGLNDLGNKLHGPSLVKKPNAGTKGLWRASDLASRNKVATGATAIGAGVGAGALGVHEGRKHF